jgi:hypothetical protein
MDFDAYVAAKVREIDERIGDVRREARLHRLAHYALAVPQMAISVAITGTSVSDLTDPVTARKVTAALGLVHLLLQAAVSALPLGRRAAQLDQEWRALTCLRNEMQLAQTHATSEQERQRLVARYTSVVAHEPELDATRSRSPSPSLSGTIAV